MANSSSWQRNCYVYSEVIKKMKEETKKNKKQLSPANSNKTAAKNTPQKKKARLKNSYFDGEEYRGYSVKTKLIRENTELYKPVKIYNAQTIYHMFSQLENLDQERTYNVVVDANLNVLSVHLAFQGTVNENLLHPREIFKVALLCSGTAIFLVHNHPSGEAKPSTLDEVNTMRIREAGRIMGIELLDHIIIGLGECYSFEKKST